MRLYDIEITLHDHGHPRLADRRPRPVQAVEQAGFVEQLTLWRIQVLSLRTAFVRPVIQRAPAKAAHPAARIEDREYQARPEAIVDMPTRLAPAANPSRDRLFFRIAQLPQRLPAVLPARWGVADLELGQRFFTQLTFFARITQRFGRRLVARLLQPILILLRHRGEQTQQRFPLLLALGLFRRARPQFHPRAPRQLLQRFTETPAMTLHGKSEDVAPFRAGAEATPAAPLRVDDEGGRALHVKGAIGLVAPPGLPQLHALADVRDQIQPRFDLIHDGHRRPSRPPVLYGSLAAALCRRALCKSGALRPCGSFRYTSDTTHRYYGKPTLHESTAIHPGKHVPLGHAFRPPENAGHPPHVHR